MRYAVYFSNDIQPAEIKRVFNALGMTATAVGVDPPANQQRFEVETKNLEYKDLLKICAKIESGRSFSQANIAAATNGGNND